MIKPRDRERSIGNPDGVDGAEGDFLMTGATETRGHSTIASELQDYVTAELHREAGVFKERREMIARQAADLKKLLAVRGGGGGSGGGKGPSDGDAGGSRGGGRGDK